MSWKWRLIAMSKAVQVSGGQTSLQFGSAINDIFVNDAWWTEWRRSGGATAERAGVDWAGVNVHAIMQYRLPYRVTLDGLFSVVSTSGLVSASVGFTNFITAIDPATLTGIGFRMAASDNLWRPFIITASNNIAQDPATYEVISAVSGLAPHRLTIELDGSTGVITWSIDGVVVGTYTVVASLGRMTTAGPRCMLRVHVPAGGDGRIRAFPLDVPPFVRVERL